MRAPDPFASTFARLLAVVLVAAGTATGLVATRTSAQDVSGGAARCGPPVTASPAVLVLSTPFIITATATPLPGADDRTTAALADAVVNVSACWNDKNWPALAQLLTPEYAAAMGISDFATFPEAMARLDAAGVLARMRVERAQFARTDGTGLATIEVRWQQASASYADLWRFVYRDGGWRLQGATPLPPTFTGDVVGLSVRLDPDRVAVTRGEIAATQTVALDVANDTGAPATFSVLTAPPDTDLTALVASRLAGSVLPAGTLSIPAGEERQLRLEALAPGTYLLVSNLNAAIIAGDASLARSTTLTVAPRPST